jgi:hypothetical protein
MGISGQPPQNTGSLGVVFLATFLVEHGSEHDQEFPG